MHRIWFWSAISVLVAVPGAEAATILSQKFALDVTASGTLRERTALKVRLETRDDLDAWSHYSVYLDEHRDLESFSASVTDSRGKTTEVRRKRQDRMEYSGEGIVESSSYYQVVEFPGLAVGSTLEVTHTVVSSPYYPTSQLGLLTSDPIAELEVVVRGAGIRWRLDGPRGDLQVEELEGGGVRVFGRNLDAIDPPELAAAGSAVQPMLRFSWSEVYSWQAVGRWYRDLLDDLPRDTAAVQQLASELTHEDQTPRQKLEELLTYLRKKIRYVAVEVGIGGYQPSSPGEVLSRKWGDCKDKSLLLIDLLGQVGIAAHPALIRLSRDHRIEPEFPSPGQFNHLIVAVPATAIEVYDDDPIADGYLFLDPTQIYGAARWLHPGVQDQVALIVTADGGHLAHTPLQPSHESRALAIDLTVSEDGDATGRAGLHLEGSLATRFIAQMENAPPERTAEDVLSIFDSLLPGAQLSEVGWRSWSAKFPESVCRRRSSSTISSPRPEDLRRSGCRA